MVLNNHSGKKGWEGGQILFKVDLSLFQVHASLNSFSPPSFGIYKTYGMAMFLISDVSKKQPYSAS